MQWNIKTTLPIKPKHPRAYTASWALATVMLGFALAHLVRIDKLVPTVGETVGSVGATWFVVLIVIVEIFALPYLLRLRLSPLMRVVSGVFVVSAPLIWTCYTVWAHGNGASTGQFSSYISTPGVWWLILLNLVWVSASYGLLWLTDFNAAFAALRKKH